MEVIISKQDFIEVINGLKAVDDYSNDLNKVFRKHNVDGYLFQPDCNVEAVNLLHIIFGELDKDDWIAYFCYDLEYGKKWEKGTVVNKDGLDIPMSTPEELYDFLLSDNNINREVSSTN